MTRLAKTNVKTARDEALEETVADVVGLEVSVVVSRMEAAHGRTRLDTLFADEWPAAAADFEGKSAAWARDHGLDEELAAITRLTARTVRGRLKKASGRTHVQNVFSADWPEASEAVDESDVQLGLELHSSDECQIEEAPASSKRGRKTTTSNESGTMTTTKENTNESSAKQSEPLLKASVITGELKSKVDAIWDTMWSGGISNPLSVIEQLTYLLFIKRLDELHTLKERKAARTGKPVEEPVFGAKQSELRWSRFKQMSPEDMFETVRDKVFPFIKNLGKGTGPDDAESTYSQHMKDALFMMPTPRVLASVVDDLDSIEMSDSDTKGDLYEYMLGKIASAGRNGQFRTPRHIIQLMVEMTAPAPKDVICDPACGTAGFLVAASEHLVTHHSESIYKDAEARRHFNEGTFHGYDFDNTMLRIGSMNMLLHGVDNPDIRYKDSLAQTDDDDAEKYSLILANPPFAGSLDYESTAKDLQQIVKTKKTELLFLALFLRLLQTGGRAAIIVPDGVLFGSSKAHKKLRQILVEEQKLDAIISMPSGVFKPYAGVSTAILFFTKTNSGGTDNVWFYDMKADGFSLDDKRTPQPEKSDLGDILSRWCNQEGESERARTKQSFCVPKSEIAEAGYDLSLNRYKEVVYEAVEYELPHVILERLAQLELKIVSGRELLQGLLK